MQGSILFVGVSTFSSVDTIIYRPGTFLTLGGIWVTIDAPSSHVDHIFICSSIVGNDLIVFSQAGLKGTVKSLSFLVYVSEVIAPVKGFR